ncbi:RING finger domain-containing protein [Emydomyces testavorans]|uniref:RING-type E3 ubiquitin transferase n=1 Tax=Emydomyces testavorans TaxID=2070801 RepID=A0AAF0DQZ2_9EURO|nr:RING finger domain-containing protein [Emydomyces testavorans]
MADPSTHIPPSTSQRGRDSNRKQRNRRGDGGGSNPSMILNNQPQRGGRGPGRGRASGRGGRGGRQARTQGGRPWDKQATEDGQDTGGEPPDRGLGGIGTSGERLTGDAKGSQGENQGNEKIGANGGAAEDADDSDVCFICASRVEYMSVAPCNHQTCHICSLRLRALYKTKACAHCRTESSFVIFTHERAKRYEEFRDEDFARTDDNLGIKYETREIFEDTVLLLRYNCPDKDCDIACMGWPDLHRHVKSKHGKVMCDLCTRNKKVFTHEHELFSMAQLRKHEKYGDDTPGALDQSGFKGHPECEFCRQRFYSTDELYTHCRDKHERCYICDRRTGGSRPQYYVDYNALEEHFGKDHFLCLDKECLEKKFMVFESQMDLKAHQLECHPSGLSKDARRDARHVDMSTFDYRTPYQPPRGRRDGRKPLGRDPNAEPVPQSSAQPLRRDELAYQRQLAIQSAQSVSTRSFGGQLSQTPPQPVRPTAPTSAAAVPQTRAASLPPMENLDLNAPAPSPQEEARRIAHAAVIDRASSLLRSDPLKINEFRNKVSLYRSSKIGANDLIESFFSLFDTSSTELGKLVKELAHLYEDESKRTGLLTAWNDWRAINEDYPALPGPSGTLPSTTLANVGGGKRVLRLKSSTAQSSQSAVSRNARLSGLVNYTSAPNPFPSLPPSSTAAGKSQKAGTASRVWATTSTPVPTPPSSSTPKISPAPSRSASRVPSSAARVSSDSDAFPALPTAPKPNVLMAGLTRGTVRWDDRSTAGGARTAVWGAGASNPTPAEAGANGIGEASQKGKGKKGKGKQVLYHFG